MKNLFYHLLLSFLVQSVPYLKWKCTEPLNQALEDGVSCDVIIDTAIYPFDNPCTTDYNEFDYTFPVGSYVWQLCPCSCPWCKTLFFS